MKVGTQAQTNRHECIRGHYDRNQSLYGGHGPLCNTIINSHAVLESSQSVTQLIRLNVAWKDSCPPNFSLAVPLPLTFEYSAGQKCILSFGGDCIYCILFEEGEL